jgi:hypothetical protein
MTRNQLTLTLLAVLSLVVAARCWYGYRSQPQLPASDEIYKTVDALFTAVTAHDSQRLASCQQRLESYKDRGSLSKSAAKRLDRIIALANSGDWTSAAHQLYDFIQAQQRKAALLPPPRPQMTAMTAH